MSAAFGVAVERTMPASAYVQSSLFLILAAVALFASAGTFAILGFWLYLSIFAAVILASLLALDPSLLRERMRPGFHWSDSVPAWVQALGLIAVAAGYALCFWAMAVNRFFSSVVRIQTDRGQHVITAGPYACMRHPGYLAGIVIMVTSGPALGSWIAAALLVVASLPFLLHRAVTEDRVLIAELPGYRRYARRVRWRILPGIW
jgi:protein-S-isoprenylcysteine O-methyltransferase Ste14